MIRVTVDLVPYGEETKARQIAEMVIANDGNGNVEFGDYVFALYDNKHGTDFGTLKNFYRGAGIWELIAQCLNNGTWQEHELTQAVIDRIGMVRNVNV